MVAKANLNEDTTKTEVESTDTDVDTNTASDKDKDSARLWAAVESLRGEMSALGGRNKQLEAQVAHLQQSLSQSQFTAKEPVAAAPTAPMLRAGWF
mmetsp:Transcript_45416/g.92780  ORF Transcript_45416/g.92780 Transcript_45416/m.92780 type:complete len:96 (-) Transcript_45416:43-330(-)